jgi:hypothetical protein
LSSSYYSAKRGKKTRVEDPDLAMLLKSLRVP